MPATIVVGALAALAIHVPAAGAAVVLNEINCEATDWVELVNTSTTPADISGWLLTDDPLDANPPRPTHQMFFSNPTVIPAGGDLVVEKVTPGGFPFGISCGDDTIRLADGTGAPVDDFLVPALAAAGDTWGRYPDGTGPWVETTSTKDAHQRTFVRRRRPAGRSGGLAVRPRPGRGHRPHAAAVLHRRAGRHPDRVPGRHVLPDHDRWDLRPACHWRAPQGRQRGRSAR